MEPIKNTPISFESLKNIADVTQPESLNDGEASHIRHLVNDFAQEVEYELLLPESLDPERISGLRENIQEIQDLFHGIFKNEKTFPTLQEAHQRLDILGMELDLEEKFPELMKSIHDIQKQIISYEMTDLSKSLNRAIQLTEKVKDKLNQKERDWIIDTLKAARQELPEAEVFDLLTPYVEESPIFDPSVTVLSWTEVSDLIESCMANLQSADFELVEDTKKLVIGLNKFDPLIDSDDLDKIGDYLFKNSSDLFLSIQEQEPSSTGDKSLYLYKEASGLPRTVQVILPEGVSDIHNMNFVIQLKQHGIALPKSINYQAYLIALEEGRGDPFEIFDKELALVGKGAFKAAKHSLLFPYEALTEEGLVDRDQIVHTTTLTPLSQGKSSLLQVIYSNLESPSMTGLITHQMDEGKQKFEDEVRAHKIFEGPGILPLIGSSHYEGEFEYSEGIVSGWMTGGGRSRVGITKSNMVTLKCDGSLEGRREGFFNLLEKKKIAEDIIAGITGIHKKGYMHGDIKPENVLFLRGKEGIDAYLCDFGFSRDWVSEDAKGTRTYIPLNIKKSRRAWRYYDVYAAGLVFLGLLKDISVYTPFPEIVERTRQGFIGIKKVRDDPALLSRAAANLGFDTDAFRERVEMKLSEIESIYFLKPPEEINEILLSDAYTPIEKALARVLFIHFIDDPASLSDDDKSLIFGEGSDISPDDDPTIILLENFLKEIQNLESEDELRIESFAQLAV